jgi:hypothetical protein
MVARKMKFALECKVNLWMTIVYSPSNAPKSLAMDRVPVVAHKVVVVDKRWPQILNNKDRHHLSLLNLQANQARPRLLAAPRRQKKRL